MVDEVIYGYLRLATGLSSKRVRQLLAKRNSKLIELIKNDVEPVLKLFIALPIALGPQEVIEFIARYGLMPADSIIALTCRQHGIDTIATFDEDFRKSRSILWKGREKAWNERRSRMLIIIDQR